MGVTVASMTMATKKEVLRAHLERYLKASRKEKEQLLDHLTSVLGMHRKAVIRALRREQNRDPWKSQGKAGRPLIYGADVVTALKEVWEISGELCAERLHSIVNQYLKILIRDDMWTHSDEVTWKLQVMSIGTMKDRIAGFQRIKLGGGRSTTKPSNLKEIIPIRRGPWKNPDPGYGEIDTVVHCGPTLSGDMAYTVNFVDIATFWSESSAQINKGQHRTKNSIIEIKRRLPFPLLGLDPDTGSEFINWVLKGWCDQEKVELTRSRPNHKNDNAHIEQRNFTNVRKLLGYSRIDTQEAVDLMNQLYAGPWRWYVNFFQPVMQCQEKKRIGSRYVRRYDVPKTPYQRVLADPRIDIEVKEKLTQQYASLNPKTLRREIDILVKKMFEVQKATKTSILF
jgi:hypothetical protein